MGKMWVFGGYGTAPSLGFLNEHEGGIGSFTNQLLCYDPFKNAWTNPKCIGDEPWPREHHATAIIKDNAFLYGGMCRYTPFESLYMINMDSLSISWTTIKTNGPNPGRRLRVSLTAVTADHLVLYGGYNFESFFYDTWIFDIRNGMWKKYTQFKDRARYGHTGT